MVSSPPSSPSQFLPHFPTQPNAQPFFRIQTGILYLEIIHTCPHIQIV